MKILITGAGGMLGSYLVEQFKQHEIVSLGLRDDSDFKVDLRKETPDFSDIAFDTVIHTAGSEDNTNAMELNLEGTRKLLEALENHPPENFVYISSNRVYSRDAGENITEETNTWASDDTGRSKALAEELLIEWSRRHDITLTIIRPARMFGNGVKGETLSLFNDALSGKYIHIRGNDAKVSLVCAYDVARGIKQVYKKGGIYNASDGHPVKFIEMVEAMTANAGYKKRMTHLPAPWAEWIWRLGRWIPSIQRNLSPETVETRMKTHTLDGSFFASETGIEYFDTIAVIERRDKNYPYTQGMVKQNKAVHEV
ncbi:MAG: NAD(P)-dependent oxidoreductase [Muribaculaceae bacterium]|nr:NAD(P)-dependent oxidoreductase [Muribaculaceae bacterium]